MTELEKHSNEYLIDLLINYSRYGNKERHAVADEIKRRLNRTNLEAGRGGGLKLTLDPGTQDRWLSEFNFLPNLTSNQWILFLNSIGATAEFVTEEPDAVQA